MLHFFVFILLSLSILVWKGALVASFAVPDLRPTRTALGCVSVPACQRATQRRYRRSNAWMLPRDDAGVDDGGCGEEGGGLSLDESPQPSSPSGSSDSGDVTNTAMTSGGSQRVQEETEREEGDRDLFIPIFSLVSIAGLLGVYAYEMIRLALRGELYLPFLH